MEKYPDEPHPNNEWKWKAFWVSKMFDPKNKLTQGDREWVHTCWIETLAGWNERSRSTGVEEGK